MNYLFVKWLHVVAIICWMAGLLYVFRLFIYHLSDGQHSSDNDKLLQVMQNRLYRIITVPAMSVAWICGLVMMHLNPSLLQQKWFHWKLTFVLLMTLSTVYAGHIRRNLVNKKFHKHSELSLRVLNEVPTVLLLIIVALVVFRPSW
jgi:protoporphyrinogen IX oxidase